MQEYEAFEQRYLAQAGDPAAVVRLFVEGMLTLERDEALGTEMMLRCCSTRHLDEASTPSGHRFRMSDREAVKLARDRSGQWKVTSLSSLTTGVRPSAAQAGDF